MDNLDSLKNKIHAFFSLDPKGIELFRKCKKLVSDNSMMDKIEKGVCVGFSGGADSVLLLSFLYELKTQIDQDYNLCALHVNHGIRGEEAKRDENFCIDFCEKIGIACFVKEVDVPSLAKKFKKSTEEAARDARYLEFHNLISGSNLYFCVATAHNATDNLETVIFNFMRGTGISGMCGISATRDYIIRPLLSLSKEEITDGLCAAQIPYVTDSTNLSVDYTRNYIRHEILPKLKRLSPSPELSSFRMTQNLRCDKDFIEGEFKAFWNSKSDTAFFDPRELRALHDAILTRVIQKMATKGGAEALEYNHVEKIKELLKKEKDFSYNIPNARFVCEKDRAFIEDINKKNELNGYSYTLFLGENYIPEIKGIIYVSSVPHDEISLNVYNFSIQAQTCSAIINSGLRVRTRLEGDSYSYGNITRKLKKLFINSKTPNSIKDLIPVVCDDSGVLWVPGFGTRDCDKTQNEKLYLGFYFNEDSPLFDYYCKRNLLKSLASANNRKV